MEISGNNSPFIISCIINETLQSGNGILIQFPRQKIKAKLKPKSTLSKSPPTSAAFFGVYNKTKSKMEYHAYSENLNQSICHIVAVYLSHSASCIFRAPVDIYRQERRACAELKPFQVLNKLACSSDIGMRLTRQLLTTVIRELPFCSIKYPLWEFLKCKVENSKTNQEHCKTHESAICGAIAGGTAAALTIPIDLANKRINVDKAGPQYTKWKLLLTIRDMHQENGFKGASLSELIIIILL
ncbi:unnamed protein product [Brachionus calyciflorus]|uniref:Uncharacterized protein n=1 Tax=Brachionus calyciflorus TaxID=104777 RepID=A0A814BEI7_9BILA|nr:unnamed protein product [Brachionus calyciflorus]